MKPLFAFIFLLTMPPAGGISGISRPLQDGYRECGGASSVSGIPHGGTGSELPAAWLGFHEAELCQGLGTVFVFQGDGVEIWCRVEDEKSYEKLRELFEPLRRAGRPIEIYATRPPEEKRRPEDNDPPPSLWNNSELRTYFQDPFAGRSDGVPSPGFPRMRDRESDFYLKQRIFLFAEQIMEWQKRMERYASDLPALARYGSAPSTPPELKARAWAVSLEHAEEAGKNAARLIDNLKRALPRTDSGSAGAGEEKPRHSGNLPACNIAVQVARQAGDVARTVRYFIHPEYHTVGLSELRDPDLIESLKALQDRLEEFAAAVRR